MPIADRKSHASTAQELQAMSKDEIQRRDLMAFRKRRRESPQRTRLMRSRPAASRGGKSIFLEILPARGSGSFLARKMSTQANRSKTSLHSNRNLLRFNTTETTAQCGLITVLALGWNRLEKSGDPRQRRGSGPSVLRLACVTRSLSISLTFVIACRLFDTPCQTLPI